jgi:hypothetical protein
MLALLFHPLHFILAVVLRFASGLSTIDAKLVVVCYGGIPASHKTTELSVRRLPQRSRFIYS